MSHVSLTVLGTCSLTVATTAIKHFPTEKVRALLVYLALEPQAHRREALAELLWPDNQPGMALRNLRLTLHRLRQVLIAVDPHLPDRLLLINRQTIQLVPSAISVDALQFESTFNACQQHGHRSITDCAYCRTQLSAAIATFQGELLLQLTLPGAPVFEEWLLLRRELLHNLALQTLHILITNFTSLGDYQQALSFAQQALTIDRFREESHRQVMLLLAYLGQPQRALTQYHHYCQSLQRELGLEPTNEVVMLMEQIKSGRIRTPSSQPHTTNPIQTSSVEPKQPLIVHNTIPEMLTEMVGRTRELSELRDLFSMSSMRLLSLIGMGGIGKTRLAIDFARLQAANYRHGVVYIALASLTSLTSVTTLMLTTLGLLSDGDPLQQLSRYLRDKQLLLVLDNAEHLLNEVGELSLALLHAAPELQILVTSREPLLIRGEYLYQLSALDNASPTGRATTYSDSVTMFVQCAKRIQANLRLDAATYASIHTICQLVQGVPLGIELAAAWASHYSCEEIANAIGQSFDFLMFRWRGAPERQQSMRAVFMWSWNLLQPEEQQALRVLALFQNGFTQEAAFEVGGVSSLVLLRLGQTSLVHHSEQATGRRYAMHELLRQYALEQFESAEQRQEAEAQHCRYYLAFLAAREHRLMNNEPRTAVAEIWGEIDNIRQAWACALQQNYTTEIEQCVDALYQFYMLSGLIADRIQLYDLACQTFAAQTAQPDVTDQTRRVYGKLLAFYSMALARTFQIKRSIEVAQMALAYREWSPVGAITAHMAWSYALFNQGDHDGSREQVELALARNAEACENQQDSPLQRMIDWAGYLWLCMLSLRLSNYQQALDHAQHARELCEALNLQIGKIDSLLSLGDVARTIYDLPAARLYYEQAQQMASKVTSRTSESRILFGLAEVLRLQGHYNQARKVLEHALAVAQATNDQWNSYLLTVALIHQLHLMGETSLAQLMYMRLNRQDGAQIAPAHRIIILLAMSAYLREIEEDAEACALAEEAWEIAYRTSHTYDQAHCLVLIAHCRASLQHPDAEKTYQQALELYESIPNPGAAAEAWAGLAMLALKRHDFAQAYQAAQQIIQSIDSGQRIGLNEPFFAYLACVHVLHMLNDPEAERIQQATHILIESYASLLDDAQLSQAFRERVRSNRLLSDSVKVWGAIR